jgi:UDP-N-acetylglucosamine 2-epimerase (non-hydrolysing)
MKIAPIIRALEEIDPWNGEMKHTLVHTGQHYSKEMSDLLFSQLEIPVPDINLAISGGDHSEQTGRIMIAFEKVVEEYEPDAVLVVGDVNSTLAASLVAAKKNVKLIHVEAGLRSGDMGMPEEVNRVVTDRLANLLFVTEPSGMSNLEREGIDMNNVFMVGNVMIDTLIRYGEKCKSEQAHKKFGLETGSYLLVTLHRPSNVDDLVRLNELVDLFFELAKSNDLIIPMHPRTEANLKKLGRYVALSRHSKIRLTGPLGYIDFVSVMSNAAGVLTDSGGVQEETTILNIRCFTARRNTERPVTISEGTNTLLSWDTSKMLEEIEAGLFRGGLVRQTAPKFWDGKAAQRIVEILGTRI